MVGDSKRRKSIIDWVKLPAEKRGRSRFLAMIGGKDPIIVATIDRIDQAARMHWVSTLNTHNDPWQNQQHTCTSLNQAIACVEHWARRHRVRLLKYSRPIEASNFKRLTGHIND